MISDSQIKCQHWSPELLKVKFKNYYLRENISFTRKNDIRDWKQSNKGTALYIYVKIFKEKK